MKTKLRLGVIVAGVVVLLGCVAAVVILVLTNHDTSSVQTLIVSTVIPTFLTLFVLGKVDKVDQKTDSINENVNGKMSKLIDKVTDEKEGEK